LTILAAIAFGIPLQFEQLYHEGITQISQQDVQYAEELGYRIKHLGIARKTDQGIELRVHPALIPEKRLLANVDGVLNAVVVQGDAVGPTLYYGPGAGAEPTASAVIADIIDVVRNINADPQHLIPYLSFQTPALSADPILPINQIVVPYYLRITVADNLGVLADLTNILSSQGINIEALIQKEPYTEGTEVDVIIITSKALEEKLDHSIAQIENLDTVIGNVKRIRVETLG
jgi:homoserine dehydrogenase